MTRLIPVLLFCGFANACAVIDMPVNDGSNPAWVEERLAEGAETRVAPVAIPERRLGADEQAELAAGQVTVLQQRDAMEAGRAENGRTATSSAEEFMADARERTTPPE